MMKSPLLMRHLFEYAMTYFPDQIIVSRDAAGNRQQYTYREYGKRTRQLSSALANLGVGIGDRVGTFLWNDAHHMEAYFAVPCMGAVLHTINIRLPGEQIAYIINHAEDRVLIVDRTLWPLLAPVRDQLRTVKAIVLTGISSSDDPPGTYDYDTLVHNGDPHFPYPLLDEEAPMGMCYTSATTGNPKGVLYTHRSMYLHSVTLGLANTLALSMQDTVMPVVPMFHVNAWGMPFAALWFGSKIVLPGPAPQPHTLLQLLRDEKVTFAAGVPTVWLGVARELEANPTPLALRAVVCGGSAAPRALIRTYEQKFNIPFYHAYGMTEISPIASVARLKSHHHGMDYDAQLDVKSTQGFLVPGLNIRLERDGQDVAWDGEQSGEMCIQGPWVADEYYHDERSADTFIDGWLHTGDVAMLDSEGYIHIVDRTKDVIKSGGEWISSVDLENALMAHPAIFEAAVVGVPHPKWDERPLAFVVFQPGQSASKDDLLQFLSGQFAKWQLPDDVIVVDEVPKTSVGKFLKRALREQYRDYLTKG